MLCYLIFVGTVRLHFVSAGKRDLSRSDPFGKPLPAASPTAVWRAGRRDPLSEIVSRVFFNNRLTISGSRRILAGHHLSNYFFPLHNGGILNSAVNLVRCAR
jgi:hypothetical protein